MIYLNLADDYFKTLQEAKMLRAQKNDLEKEIYSLKHELIGVQMKLDAQMEKNEK
jgi:cell division protein ZapA